MGGTTQTSSSSTGSSNPNVTATTSALAKGLGALATPGATSYTAPGSTTTGGQQASLDAANNPLYASGINGAIGSFGNVASGANIGQNDPGYAALRSKLSNDVLTQTNQSFNNSGLFGSDSNQKAAASGLADSLGALDYGQYKDSLDRQTQAAQLLPGLFSAGQLPSSVQQSVGASQDAAANAQHNGQLDFLSRLTSAAAGNAASAGTTTTNTQPGTPLWQTLLGLGIGGAGLLGG